MKANDIAQSNGASIWLSTLPIKEENFNLNKREFFDAIYLRYKWDVKNFPAKCACQQRNSIEHALSCHLGGYIILRHNEIRDVTAELVNEICKDVKVEPLLQPLNNDNGNLQKSAISSDEARADLSMLGFWQRGQRAFLDFKVINPHARCYQNQSLSSMFKSNESDKKRAYNRRIMYHEQATFTPVIFSINGGLSREH